MVATKWTEEVAAALEGCPMDEMVEKVKAALKDGGSEVTLTREANAITVKIKKGRSISTSSGSWG